ncbi:glycerate kinase [Massilia sp. W12]|uniref:glycerate kinase type-2 family protein n=1 Tax=Massilia sp. W12 TaxID=3126507 RepID=UPI0030CCB6A8
MKIEPGHLLAMLFAKATAATQAANCLPPHLPPPPRGRILALGAGKAAAAMARAVELHYPQSQLSGLVVTRYGHRVPCQRIEVVEAAHPTPDEAGEQAAARMLALAQELGEDDLLLCLISGGGSALLPLPAAGITLADKQAITRHLLSCGAPIAEINVVRKHLSAIKGGRLAQAAGGAQVLTLIISDVPGDDPAMVASGPTLADASTCAQALAICERWKCPLPPHVQSVLAQNESVKQLPPQHSAKIIASNQHALHAAASVAQQFGVRPYILSDAFEGEAREVAKIHAALVMQALRNDPFCPFQRPCLLLSGGETTVTLEGNGRGGRNTEFLLALALALPEGAPVYGIACDTDGIDGSEQNAGAGCHPDTLTRARALGINGLAHLNNHDAYGFFSALGDLIVTGPSLTNVNDFRAILIL